MPTAKYDEIAEWYDGAIRSSSLIHELLVPSLFDLTGSVDGQYVCDLACGQGVIARQLASRGAKVVGIDLSLRLLEIGMRAEDAEPSGVIYLQGDAQALTGVEDAIFDGVLCNMALMDIPDLRATFEAVWRVL